MKSSLISSTYWASSADQFVLIRMDCNMLLLHLYRMLRLGSE